jgi:large subunit ribosomal protein L23
MTATRFYLPRYTKPVVPQEAIYKIVLGPLVSEKGRRASEINQIGFWVALQANKAQIKIAVERLFNVKVLDVNTLIRKGKKKRFRGRVALRSDRKKAFVRLDPTSRFDLEAIMG